jgi:hypothetical protein
MAALDVALRRAEQAAEWLGWARGATQAVPPEETTADEGSSGADPTPDAAA